MHSTQIILDQTMFFKWLIHMHNIFLSGKQYFYFDPCCKLCLYNIYFLIIHWRKNVTNITFNANIIYEYDNIPVYMQPCKLKSPPLYAEKIRFFQSFPPMANLFDCAALFFLLQPPSWKCQHCFSFRPEMCFSFGHLCKVLTRWWVRQGRFISHFSNKAIQVLYIKH